MITYYKGKVRGRINVGKAVNESGKYFIQNFIKKMTYLDFANRKKVMNANGVLVYALPEVKAHFYVHVGDDYYFPRAVAEEFVNGLANAGNDITEIKDYVKAESLSDGVHIDVKLYDIQKKALESFDTYPDASKLLSLQPGGGKTFTSLVRAVNNGERTLIFCQANLIEQWLKETASLVGDKATLVNIQGTDKLVKVANKIKDGDIDPDFIFIPLPTWGSYVRRWIAGEHFSINPPDVTKSMSVGTVLSDEAHTTLQALWYVVSMCECNEFIGLSGTMSDDDPKMEAAQNYMFPLRSRFTEDNLKPYVTQVVLVYGLKHPKDVVCTYRGRSTYNQGAYEKWILMATSRRNAYFNLILDAVNKSHFMRKKKGDRLMIFFASIKMIASFKRLLHDIYPNVKVVEYIAGISKEDAEGAEIILTTLIKSGKAVDFKGLTTVINTISVAKKETAQQLVQRLRRPKQVALSNYLDDYIDDTPRMYVQLLNKDIPTHFFHYRNRKRSLEQLFSTTITENTGIEL